MRTTIPGFTRKRRYNTTGFRYYCFGVNYDDFDSLHDSALFRFDPVTLEYEEINSRSGLDIGGCYFGLTAIGDKLYFHDNHNKAFDSYVYSSVSLSIHSALILSFSRTRR